MEFNIRYDGPWTDVDPDARMTLKVCEWRYQKPVFRTSKCCHCGSCFLFCPTGCIEDRGGHFEVNLNFCKGCGLCAGICPVHAIKMVLEGNE